jgi:DNA polymerase III subunit epsilon
MDLTLERLRQWLGLKNKPLSTANPSATTMRWVVLDVETSGLDVNTAQLLAVACVGLQVDWHAKTICIVPGDSFEIVIKPAMLVEDESNILIHGIGRQRQQLGVPCAHALTLLRDFLQDCPLLAFHAWFDQTLLGRYYQSELGTQLPNPWLDIEKLCAVMQPKVQAQDLDQWLAHFNIVCASRHEAASDAFAEAEVLQRIWPLLIKDMGMSPSWQALKKLEKLKHWLPRS